MRLWCRSCLTVTNQAVTKTYTLNSADGRRRAKRDRIELTPHDGIIPVIVHGTCGCGREGVYVSRSQNILCPSCGRESEALLGQDDGLELGEVGGVPVEIENIGA